ncbi:MAG: hypothetical protein AAF975_08640, partial [Spirochaetota bacterium]
MGTFWPLIGTKTVDIEQLVADSIEEIARSARIYELHNLDPAKFFIPIFFFDAEQEIFSHNGREPALFPYFKIERKNDTHENILQESTKSAPQVIKGKFSDNELADYWDRDGKCYLDKATKDYLQSGADLSLITGVEYCETLITARMFHKSST